MDDEFRANVQLARVYIRKVGYDPDEVAKVFPLLAARKHGRPSKGNDDESLGSLERHLRNWMKQTKQERGPALLAIVTGFYIALGPDQCRAAVSPKALAGRLEKKLRDRGYKAMPDSALPEKGLIFLPLIRALKITPKQIKP